jgi:hypothetical protein
MCPETLSVMSRIKQIKESLDWISHGKLIVELILAFAGKNAVKAWLMSFTNIREVWKSPIEWASAGLILGVLILIFNKKSRGVVETNRSPLLANADSGGLPADINIDEFFRVAYISAQQTEVEKNFKLIAAQKQPDDPAAFYLKFIGVGFIQALFDSLWWPMFKSQLVALLEINKHQGALPIANVKTIYIRASEEYPDHYANDTFERWLGYLTKNGLVLNHPTGIVEITVRGKDFLKYLVHWGREPNDKRL